MNAENQIIEVEFKSSNIASARYDKEKKELELKFMGSADKFFYRYADVNLELVDEFLRAESVGSFFAKRIKGHFAFVKVDAQDTGKDMLDERK